MRMRGFCIAAPALACMLAGSGCGLHAVVADVAGNTTDLRRVRLENPRKLEVLDGEAALKVRFRKVRRLSLDPSEARTVDGKLYYRATIALADNQREGRGRDVKASSGRHFVAVQNALRGKRESGRYRITLDNIATVAVQD